MRIPQHDEALLARLKAGEEDALGDLIDAYGTKIYQLAFRYLRNKEDAEEVTQDVLYKVYRKAEAFRGDAAFSSWIYRITFNAAMSRLRSGRHEPARTDEPQFTTNEGDQAPVRNEIADWSNMADESVLRSQLRRRLFTAILALPA
jgi:RNA polymerase sigma-70 factor (ECF subfamily)